MAHIETITTPEERQTLAKLFANASLSTCDLPRYNCPTLTAKVYGASNLSEATAQLYKFPGENLRKIHELALTAMLTAAAIKDLHNMVISFIISVADMRKALPRDKNKTSIIPLPHPVRLDELE